MIIVFFRLFQHAKQRLFVPPIMMIESNFPCSNKKTNMHKNSIKKINGLSVVHAARKKTMRQKFI